MSQQNVTLTYIDFFCGSPSTVVCVLHVNSVKVAISVMNMSLNVLYCHI